MGILYYFDRTPIISFKPAQSGRSPLSPIPDPIPRKQSKNPVANQTEKERQGIRIQSHCFDFTPNADWCQSSNITKAPFDSKKAQEIYVKKRCRAQTDGTRLPLHGAGFPRCVFTSPRCEQSSKFAYALFFLQRRTMRKMPASMSTPKPTSAPMSHFCHSGRTFTTFTFSSMPFIAEELTTV